MFMRSSSSLFSAAIATLASVAILIEPLRGQDKAGTTTTDNTETARELEKLIITTDCSLTQDMIQGKRIIVTADNITLDGGNVRLIGPGVPGEPETFRDTGVELLGCTNVTVRNMTVSGFAIGLKATGGSALIVEDCDFSDNYHHPDAGWGDGPHQGGVLLQNVSHATLRNVTANHVWNGLDLRECNDCFIVGGDFSHCSAVGLRMWKSSRNRIIESDFSHGLRIDRSKGEVHARDSTCVLLETGSNDNYFYRNLMTDGGDGLFIRVLNNWVSTGNVFVENDMSRANNNCVESWSPGNTYIRNIANHGSYGFWLGGSDQTVLIGNTAAYNGLEDSFRNAPEREFKHAGISIVRGPASHTIIEGNYVHHNGGAGIAFRGDDATAGKRWRSHHWIIQNNRIEHNRWGIWGRWGDWIDVLNNSFVDNAEGNYYDDVTNLHESKSSVVVAVKPRAVLSCPLRAFVGEKVVIDGTASFDPQGLTLTHRISVGDRLFDADRVEHIYETPGFRRVGLTVSNGTVADMAFRDLLVIERSISEFGTDDEPSRWRAFVKDGDPKHNVLQVTKAPDPLIGRRAIRVRADAYTGEDATLVYAAPVSEPVDATQHKSISLWIRTWNDDNAGWEDPGPVVQLHSENGFIRLAPGPKAGNPIRALKNSEARWMWSRLEIPLNDTENQLWARTEHGTVDAQRITSISFTFDSRGNPRFMIDVDGVTFN